MNKTLIVCPTVRPDKFKIMVNSLTETTRNCDIIHPNKPGSITKIMNNVFNKFSDYEYYHITNDDFVYKTKDWNELFIEKLENNPGICHANDKLLNGILPVAPFISGDIVRSLGWLQMPSLYHLCGDMVWDYIGKQINRLYYFKDVIIEHVHPLRKDIKVEKDSVFKLTNSKEMYRKDHEAYKIWLQENSFDQIEKLRFDLDL